jgi:hypothetical protein
MQTVQGQHEIRIAACCALQQCRDLPEMATCSKDWVIVGRQHQCGASMNDRGWADALDAAPPVEKHGAAHASVDMLAGAG